MVDKWHRFNCLNYIQTHANVSKIGLGNAFARALAGWMKPEQIPGRLLDLLREGRQGRSGENIGVWTGVPVELGPRKAPHRTITG